LEGYMVTYSKCYLPLRWRLLEEVILRLEMSSGVESVD
jgi:hypothetical protein